MQSEMVAVMEIIVRSGSEMEMIMAKLQTEPSAKALHSLQGENAGYKDLLSAISAEFKIPQTAIEYKGDQPMLMPDMSDEQLEYMSGSIKILIADERWAGVVSRLEEKTESMKTFLLFEATSAADLDIAQGKQRSFTSYNAFFNAVDQEVRRRAAKEAAKAEEPDLPFEDAKYAETEESTALVPQPGRAFAVIRGGAEA